MSSMITATAWVRRGVAAQFPTKYEIDEEEMNRISKLAKMQLEDAQGELSAAREGKDKEDEDMDEDKKEGGQDSMEEDTAQNAEKNGKTSFNDDDDLKEYDLDHYDSDEVDEEGEKVTMFGNVKSLAYHQPNEEDPYLVIPEDEEDEEREELQILPSDNLLLAGKVEDEVAHLEVYVYEDREDNLYVHHDIMLPAIPLCVEWLDIPVGMNAGDRTTGNFVAVGTMEPDIEIWDLDIVDCMYPNAILGQGGADLEGEGKKAKKPKKKTKANDDFHVDSVLALAANRQHRNLLASASADRTVKLWDLNTTKCAKSYSHHTDKVCSLDWHPKESTVLLTGSYDRTVVAADMRAPDAKARWGVDADVETVRWDMHDPNFFYVTTDGGMVYRFDIRNIPATPKESKPVWTLQAHDSSVSSFDINPAIPGFLVTGSTDKQVKLWNVENDKPSMVVSRKLEVGKVFSTTFAPDPEVSFRLAVAGSKGVVQIWDTSTNGAVRRAFVSRMPAFEGEVKERMIGLPADNDESDDDDGGEEAGAAQGGDGWESMDED
ncbi:rRNA-processing protein PWP1 [Aspergillus clavatus NRRL 1]|uniref:rRNA processing protein Pwp1, putative n=1 Tax=Aspergillus clavatus (strain ATCC 1007 / CBS 513.65 / DSM 816 / NCTC 3887 / NRRL 1 / QM 1276 / 107) TaxID=344612 RepID=A1CS22_ASPCL|nr:rRNA processing protein Pwp1, putative [Aspergillus clavatus NRRL 1]EAW08443.1 rRNA processing protein Pwp1, putative [Aspergillus clavatus NRRL 1]